MTTTYTDDTPATLVAMTNRQLLQILLVGALTGIVAWGLTYIFNQYVYITLLCHGTATHCSMSTQYAAVSANILAIGAGLFGLVRLQVFRPLLIVLASTLMFWGLVNILTSLPWYDALLASAGLYALAYALFAWIDRIRAFVLALVIMAIVVVGVRLILNG
jgi:hypothetical protein